MYPKPTPEEIAALPIARCGKPIYLVPKEISVREALRAINEETLLGFDTETKPAFKAGQSFPPALIQIATANAVYLFQMRLIREKAGIRNMLLSKSLKAGVGVGEDLHRLQYYFNIPMGRNFCDLTKLAKQKGVEAGSLRGLYAALLKKRLSKSVQLSNWAHKDLSPQQVHYAALDAWASREVYLALQTLS
jgi:ribonuclease D